MGSSPSTRAVLGLAALAALPALRSAQEVADRAVTDDGHTVLRTNEPVTVYEALELARAVGGTLVTIASAEKETWLLENFGASEPYWIGLEFPRDGWESGAAVAFTHWAPAQPNGGSREAFTLMNWDTAMPGCWGDVSGDVTTDRFRALIEVPRRDVTGLPALAARPANRGVLLLAVQGLVAKDLASPKYPNLLELWKRSAWTFDAGADSSGDALAGLGMLLWGVGSARSSLASSEPERADRGTNQSLLTRLEAIRPEVTTVALFDDAMLAGVLLDGPVDLRITNASPRKPGGATGPVVDALARPMPLCIVATWTDLFTPEAGERTEAQRARSIAVVDKELGALLARLGARPDFAGEEWLLVLAGLAPVAGKSAKPDKSEEDLRRGTAVPLLVVHPSVPPGELVGDVLLVDLAPTLLAHFGVEARRGWQLDGRALALGRPSAYGANLIVNGDAEAQFGWGQQGRFPVITGWRTLAPFFRGRHATETAGPERRGQSFFQGLVAPLARLEQTIDLGALDADIDRGEVRFRLAGWLGGKGDQAPIQCAVEFLSEQRKVLGSSVLGPVGPMERRAALGAEKGLPLAGLIPVEQAGKVPRRTRMARVILSASVPGRVDSAMADELSLVLERGE